MEGIVVDIARYIAMEVGITDIIVIANDFARCSSESNCMVNWLDASYTLAAHNEFIIAKIVYIIIIIVFVIIIVLAN